MARTPLADKLDGLVYLGEDGKFYLRTDTELTVDGSTLATQATLAQIKAKTDNLDIALSALLGDTITANLGAVDNAVLDAIEASISAIKAKTDNLDIALSDLLGDTITANLGAVDNAVLDAIEASIDAINTNVDAILSGQLPDGHGVTIDSSSIIGPGAPNIDSYGDDPIVDLTGANQALVAVPGANKQIWVYGIQFTCSVDGTVSLQDSNNGPIMGVVSYAQYSGPFLLPSGNFAMPLYKVGTGLGLQADITTATINGAVQYAIVSV